ncbi:MAG: hypothetical protein A3G25_17155 [Betaproteobacteria bacterium RIFCSPLOWO2_12_FULL_63_13]|nr:MAG: hypothetical protein A3G25_17155 [Betaproteobacteria bacterium RIFCSPLOWO2_12_FULL_63_13]
MHIVLISACEKKALKRTRAVLDSYAMRSGDHTWLTPITAEGLAELRLMLRRTATRQTSIACFRNDGRSRMKLLWIVGSKANFNKDGVSPVATQARKQRGDLPEWVRVCALIASAAGYMHDLGKFGKAFQHKLRVNGPVADEVRHEWLSLLIVRLLMNGATWAEAWKAIGDRMERERYADVTPFDRKLSSARDALLYLIATHHKLPSCDGPGVIGNANHVRDKSHIPCPVSAPSAAAMEHILGKIAKTQACPARDRDPLYWRSIATISRMALILADHSVSAETHLHSNTDAYANTDRSTGQLNQSLSWHLENVGRTAGNMVYNMFALSPPALSIDTIERICAPSTGIYVWQERASRALSTSIERGRMPHLVLNMAGTGAGKTRMNVRAICSLNEGTEVRLATALNLRTLALQTGDAYAEQLDIGKDELTCVIGDKMARELHDYQKSLSGVGEPMSDDDENPVEEDFETIGQFEYTEAPDWLRRFMRGKPNLGAVVGSPVLVSTIDFLIAAGEPHRQGNHALAALRIMTSDLILDEIDGYDPKALLSVLRLVMTSALFGRNVVASSATLSRPVARLLWLAYAKGTEMRGLMSGIDCKFRTAIIDDLVSPGVAQHSTCAEFMASYETHVSSMLEKLTGRRFRVPLLQKLETKDVTGWHAALRRAVATMHSNQSWTDPQTGKKLSIGLVRMANIRPAVEVSMHLAKHFPQARVACYHSQHFPIQRFHIEQRLDFLLSRKNGDAHILADPEIRSMLDSDDCRELMLIVVATPVEEIGRDHDFDWAVVEPSSTQSIVQTAGRVNRHRLNIVYRPNVALLQFNRKEVEPNAKRVFQRPGLEVGKPYETHDLDKLFDWSVIEQVDARLRFGNHLFPKLDDNAIESETNAIFTRMTSSDQRGSLWMALETYTKSRLRDNDDGQRIEMTLLDDPADGRCFLFKEENSKDKPVSRLIGRMDQPESSAWLSKPDQELAELARTAGVDVKRAMTVSVRAKHVSDVARHPSFGFYPAR